MANTLTMVTRKRAAKKTEPIDDGLGDIYKKTYTNKRTAKAGSKAVNKAVDGVKGLAKTITKQNLKDAEFTKEPKKKYDFYYARTCFRYMTGYYKDQYR